MNQISMRNFLIVGTQRSGSGALAEALNCHPAIVCGAEWTLRTWRKLSIADAALGGNFRPLPPHHATEMALRLSPGKTVLGFRRLFRASSRWIGHPRLAPALLLDRLVRQGRAFGIHVLLGSQTLSGAYSLARSTTGQMAVRVALQCSEADANLILPDERNDAARFLSRPGEAIYNDQNGLLAGNHPFQVVWLPEEHWFSHVVS